MLKKITSIKNIGKFRSYEASDISLKPFVAIYSENGKGKTTLTSILRSLAKNNPRIILGRRRLNEAGRPHFKIETHEGFIEFKDEQWTASFSGIEVFDSNFIHDNVYSGMQVELAQKRNLYKFIIGDEAIRLNEDVINLNNAISDLTSKIRDKRGELAKETPPGTDVSLFVKLNNVEQVDLKIEAKEKEVVALSKKSAISKKTVPTSIQFPIFTFENLEAALKRTLPDVEKDAEALTQKHIRAHLDNTGEQWLKLGVGLLGSRSSCPFCATDISSSQLIKAYREYFSAGYAKLKEDIEKARALFQQQYSDAYITRVRSVVASNATIIDGWREFLEFPASLLEQKNPEGTSVLEKAIDEMSLVFEQVSELVARKQLAPLEFSEPDSTIFVSLKSQWQKTVEILNLYNSQIFTANELIEVFRRGLTTGDLEVEKRGLEFLKATKLRYSENIASLCNQFCALEIEKTTLEERKEAARKNLDDATNAIPAKYQVKINEYLERFAADFHIYDHKKTNPRGEPATEYKIIINGAEVPIGDSATPDEVASFKNTLSEGDKSTLAFSYFLAKLDSDLNLTNKIVVFDDPISSLDSSRREWTKRYLKWFGSRAKQLIVLSHDSRFLHELDQALRTEKHEMTCIQILPGNEGSVLAQVDFREIHKSRRGKDLEAVKAYVEKRIGKPSDVIRAIRPLCEDYVKDQCPNSIGPKDALGAMIGKIRESATGSDLERLKSKLLDLESLNGFTTSDHHGQSEGSNSENETQLFSQCQLTLRLIGEL